MTAFFEHVEFAGNAGFGHGHGKQERIFGRNNGVFERMNEECRGRVLGDLSLIREAFDEFFGRIITKQIPFGTRVTLGSCHGDDRVHQDHEVRT